VTGAPGSDGGSSSPSAGSVPGGPVRLEHLAQVPGVSTVVTSLAEVPVDTPWSESAIAAPHAVCARHGLRWTVVESVPVHESIELGASGRDDALEAFALTVAWLGRLGVGTVCYHFMPVFDWMRTEFARRLDDGSEVMASVQRDLDAIDLSAGLPQLAAWPKGYDAAELAALLERYQEVDAALLAHYRAFVAAVAPAAERAGVRLAIHPDDPPWPIFGLPRIVNDEASLQAVLDVSTSPAHGLTFCTGALGPGPTPTCRPWLAASPSASTSCTRATCGERASTTPARPTTRPPPATSTWSRCRACRWRPASPGRSGPTTGA
jgi:mannonate dehydratase